MKHVSREILPAVGRRDNRRQQVEAWTGGNRVLRSEETHILTFLFHAFQALDYPMTAVEQKMLQP